MLVCVYCMICRQTRGLSTTVNYCQLCIYIYIIFTITGNLMTHQHCKPRWVLFMIFVLFFSFLCVLNYIQQLHPLLYVVVVVVAPEKKKRTKTHGPPCTATHAPRGRYESKHEVTQPRAKTGVLYLPTYLAMYVLYEYTYTVLVVVFEPYATHSNIEQYISYVYYTVIDVVWSISTTVYIFLSNS